MIEPTYYASSVGQWAVNEAGRVWGCVNSVSASLRPQAPQDVLNSDTLSTSRTTHRPVPLLTRGQLLFFNSLFSIGSGLCGMMVSLHQINAITLTLTPRLVMQLGNVFFTVAYLVDLYGNLARFADAERHIHAGDAEADHAALIRRSALIGAFSGSSYLAMGMLSVFGVCPMLAAFCGGVAMVASGAQWLHDYFLLGDLPQKKEEETSLIKEQSVVDVPINELEKQVRHAQLTSAKV